MRRTPRGVWIGITRVWRCKVRLRHGAGLNVSGLDGRVQRNDQGWLLVMRSGLKISAAVIALAFALAATLAAFGVLMLITLNAAAR